MASNVRHLTRFGRGRGKAAVIAGAAAAMLSTGTATAASITPTHAPSATITHQTPRHYNSKPRTGSGRDPVQLGPGRDTVAAQLVPGKPLLDLVTA